AAAVLAAWAGVAALAWTGALGLGAAFGLQVVLAYLSFTPLHEASHGNIAGRAKGLKGVERLVGWLAGVPLLAPYPAFRKLHLDHHGHTNDHEHDPDFWVAGGSRGAVLLRCLTILPHYYWRIVLGAVRSPSSRDTASILALLAYATLAASFAAAGRGGWVLAVWVGPALLSAAVLAFAFDWLPHHPHSERGRYRNSRILLFPGLEVLLASQNLHLIHHLYPRIPFYRYAPFFREVRSTLEAKGAPIVDLAAPRDGPPAATRTRRRSDVVREPVEGPRTVLLDERPEACRGPGVDDAVDP
ncbi:MAG: fatty acid desaturase, partial [Acidobacteriota bacterium]